jgi:HTH-type transcriptional regulator, quorum sensing regulator NprR
MSTSRESAYARSVSLSTLGQRIRTARKGLGMTQQELAAPLFGKAYVSAIERGAVRPSLKALEFLAERLNIPASALLSAQEGTQQEAESQLALAAIEEDLRYQINYAKMLIRSNQVDKALQAITDAERAAQPYLDSLPPNVRYLLPFTRGRAYVELLEPALARAELEEALKLAEDDEEAVVHVRNLLGVVFYIQEQPRLALGEHLKCLEAVRSRIKDPNFRLSVYRNLANEYYVLNEPSEAIGIYKEALAILEDLDDLQRQAGVFWGLSMAYKAQEDGVHAKLYATRALHIYEAADNRSDAASIGTNLAEILIEEGRYADAEPLLKRAEQFLVGSGNASQLSILYRTYADMARRQGQYDLAADYADRSVKSAEDARAPLQSGDRRSWVEAIRAHAEALHISALVQEALGHKDAADRLFRRALEEINQTTVLDTIRSINLSYAEVLQARGAYEQAIEHYRNAAYSRYYNARQDD